MNILFVLNAGNPGGVEQHVRDLSKGLVKHGHTVFVWCREGKIVDWYTEAGALVTKTNIGFEIDPIYIAKLVKFLKENKIDIIHAHELKAGVNALLAGFLADTKVRITHVHTPMSEWRVSGELKKIYTKIEIFFYTTLVNLLATKEIALTESRKQKKIKEGIKESKLVVIPNGLEYERFLLNEEEKIKTTKAYLKKHKVPEDAIVIGAVSRLTEEKGHPHLINAFAEVLKRVPNKKVHLLLAGGGKLESTLKKQISDLGISKSVSITGVFDNSETPIIYSSLDIFVFPSLAEGFGIVLMEAMASGVPVISSDLEVLKEVGGGGVTYFETGNHMDLADKIYDLIHISNRGENTTEMNRQRVSNLYSMQKFIDNYLRLYKDLSL